MWDGSPNYQTSTPDALNAKLEASDSEVFVRNSQRGDDSLGAEDDSIPAPPSVSLLENQNPKSRF